MVVKDGHRWAFNLNPSGDKNTKSRQGFWKVASNCPMYHRNTYHISKYNLCDTISKWNGKVSLQNIPTTLLQNWNKQFKFVNNIKLYIQLKTFKQDCIERVEVF
jgi:hypothetical protein